MLAQLTAEPTGATRSSARPTRSVRTACSNDGGGFTTSIPSRISTTTPSGSTSSTACCARARSPASTKVTRPMLGVGSWQRIGRSPLLGVQHPAGLELGETIGVVAGELAEHLPVVLAERGRDEVGLGRGVGEVEREARDVEGAGAGVGHLAD